VVEYGKKGVFMFISDQIQGLTATQTIAFLSVVLTGIGIGANWYLTKKNFEKEISKLKKSVKIDKLQEAHSIALKIFSMLKEKKVLRY